MVLQTAGTGNLFVEDGTGYENADAYIDIEFADEYLLTRFDTTAWLALDVLVRARAIRKATMEWAEGLFQGKWRGGMDDIVNPSQSLSWPRIGAFDDDGRLIENDTVPLQLKQAVALVAYDVAIGGKDVLTSSTPTTGNLIRETKKGAGFEKTQEWDSSGGTSGGLDVSLVRFRASEALVYPLLRGSDGGVSRS